MLRALGFHTSVKAQEKRRENLFDSFLVVPLVVRTVNDFAH